MEHDLKFWKKLATDMVVVLGNNPYMAKTAMMSWITKMGDAEEQVSLLALADNITKRLLEIKPEEWDLDYGKNPWLITDIGLDYTIKPGDVVRVGKKSIVVE